MVQVVDQVRIVGAAVGQRDERDHMDLVVKQLFLYQVGQRADEEDNW